MKHLIALRIKDAAEAVGLSRSTLYKLIASQKLRTVKVAGRRLVPLDALHALIHDPGLDSRYAPRLHLHGRSMIDSPLGAVVKVRNTAADPHK